MKVAIECKCLLLKESLKLFLKDQIYPKDEASLIICDYEYKTDKIILILGKDLRVPFTKEDLISSINEANLANSMNISNLANLIQNPDNNPNLEDQIDTLLNKFKKDLIQIIKNAK